jgi:hypothetical protein
MDKLNFEKARILAKEVKFSPKYKSSKQTIIVSQKIMLQAGWRLIVCRTV